MIRLETSWRGTQRWVFCDSCAVEVQWSELRQLPLGRQASQTADACSDACLRAQAAARDRGAGMTAQVDSCWRLAGRDVVRCTITPDLLRRIVYRQRTTTCVVERSGGCWSDAKTGRLVDWATSRAIDAALRGAA